MPIMPWEWKKKSDGYEEQREKIILVTGAILSAPLIIPMLSHLFNLHIGLAGWIQLVLATPVQFIVGWPFYRNSWRALRAGVGNMDLLVAMGTSAAYFYSLGILFFQNAWLDPFAPFYFEAAAVIIILVRFGRWLEARAKRATGNAIRALMDLRPDMAHVERAGRIEDVRADDLKKGDIVWVRPGERIPVDGQVIDGESDVNESLITGESMPIVKRSGHAVIAGAINGAGQLRVETLSTAEHTKLARIIALVREAQSGKTDMQRLADKVSGVFVPIVIVIALATFAAWGFFTQDWTAALVASVSVLVIACPCALGLATPTAIMAGTGAAAKSGILIRDPAILEKIHTVNHVLFDKTGTLTEGRPKVTKILAQDVGENELLALAAAAQSGSEHPIGRAIRQAAQDRGLNLPAMSEFKSFAGKGLRARVDGRILFIGNRNLMGQEGQTIQPMEQAWIREEEAGQTVIAVAQEGRVLGLIAVADAIKPDAKNAVSRIKALGIRVGMITGDGQGAAARVAREVGLDDVRAEILPEHKAETVKAIQADKAAVVAMVGDGVNDAPALAQADIGIAMGSGSDVAMETASMTLMRSNPALVADAIDIAKRTRRKIYENLFWAFIYNIVGIPLAALGLLTPVIAGAAMSMSSVSVVTNALFLRRWRAKA